MKESSWTLKSALKIAFPIAAVQFGVTCGPSMATGAYATQYFTRWGRYGLLMLLLYMVMTGIGLFFGLYLSASHRAYNYKAYYGALYGSKYKYVEWLLDIYSVLQGIIGEAAQLALGGVMFNTLFGWHPIVGSSVMAVIIIMLMVYGDELIRKSSVFMTYVLLAGFAILLYFAVTQRGATIMDNLSAADNFKLWEVGALSAGWWTITQFGWNSMNGAGSLCNVAQKLRDKKDVIVTSILTPILVGGLFLITMLITLGYSPEVLNEASPNLTIVMSYIAPVAKWVVPVYYIIMFFALASSGPALTYNVANRWADPLFGKTKMSRTLRVTAVAVILNIVCVIVSTLGLTTLISKGFTTLGLIAFPLIIIPLLLFSYRKSEKKMKEREEAVMAEESEKTEA